MPLHPDWKLVPVPMSNEFIDALHAALPLCRYSNRSDFIRDAIVEKLERQGIKVDRAIVAAPIRVGKKPRTKPRPLANGKGDFPGSLLYPEARQEISVIEDRPNYAANARAEVRKFEAGILRSKGKASTH